MPQQLPVPVDPSFFGSLEPDNVLPEQFFPEQRPNWSAELSLLWSVFWDGLEIFQKEILLGREHSEVYLETVDWMERTGDDSILSFERLCEVFGLLPARVREALFYWRERNRHQPKAA